MKSLKIRLIGGLGNQLFQVAFGYSLRRIYSIPVIYDISAFKNYKLHKLVVDKLFPNMPFLNIKNNIFQIPIKEKYCGFDEMLFQRITNSLIYRNIYLSGYFQSLAYFSNELPEIKSLVLIGNSLTMELGYRCRTLCELTKALRHQYGGLSSFKSGIFKVQID